MFGSTHLEYSRFLFLAGVVMQGRQLMGNKGWQNNHGKTRLYTYAPEGSSCDNPLFSSLFFSDMSSSPSCSLLFIRHSTSSPFFLLLFVSPLKKSYNRIPPFFYGKRIMGWCHIVFRLLYIRPNGI